MPDLADLIERLEKATEGSRKLDALIWQALHPDQPFMVDAGSARPPKRKAVYAPLGTLDFTDWDDEPMKAVAVEIGAPAFTTSLDAALSLVPEGCFYTVTTRHHLGVCSAEAFVWSQTDECLGRATAKTAELSLGAAALKARQAAS